MVIEGMGDYRWNSQFSANGGWRRLEQRKNGRLAFVKVNP